jgi:hypothetical protein
MFDFTLWRVSLNLKKNNTNITQIWLSFWNCKKIPALSWGFLCLKPLHPPNAAKSLEASRPCEQALRKYTCCRCTDQSWTPGTENICSAQYFLFSAFFFVLAYISCIKRFCCAISIDMYSVCSPPPLLQTVFSGFHYAIFLYAYKMY